MYAPIQLSDVHSLLRQMLASPSDMVRESATLRDMVRNLPPEQAELLSRYRFDRGTLQAYVANFFDVAQDRQNYVETIRIPHDAWIRGVQAHAVVALDEEETEQEGTVSAWEQRRAVCRPYGTGFRALFDVNWRLNSRQGFVTDGSGEVLAPATLVAGDGIHSVPMDWRLQKEDTIKVRVRNRTLQVFPAGCANVLAPAIPWIAVVFWAEELPQPRP
jgi:hypothetical protein